MKKFLLFLLVTGICFCAVGCNKVAKTDSSGLPSIGKQTETNSTTENTSTPESKVNEENSTNSSVEQAAKEENKTIPSSDETMFEWLNNNFNSSCNIDDAIAKKVVDMCGSTIVLNDGTTYEYSMDILFSNGTHLKKYDDGLVTEKFLNDGGKILSITKDGNVYTPSINPQTEEIEMIKYTELDKYNLDYAKVFTVRNTNLESTFFTYSKNSIQSIDGKYFHQFTDDETILWAINNTVKTTKGYYSVTIQRFQEYADIEPQPLLEVRFIKSHPELTFFMASERTDNRCKYAIYKNFLYVK